MEFKKCIIALLAFNFVVSLAGIAVAREDEEVVVRGVGAIIDGNIAVAKKKP